VFVVAVVTELKFTHRLVFLFCYAFNRLVDKSEESYL